MSSVSTTITTPTATSVPGRRSGSSAWDCGDLPPQQVQLFFLFDREVRSGRATQAVPAGYANFASNYYAEGRSEAFAWSVDPDILEIDMASCFTVKDFESLLPDGAKVLTPEEAKLFDRMLLMSAMRSVSHEERSLDVRQLSDLVRLSPARLKIPSLIKKMKFNKVKAEPVPKGKGKSEVRQLTEEELAAKKEKKAAKRARKANRSI
ncbi:hypothetical protein B0H13DRAFT_2326369 [Mycena leptocephala]|nr:hypothetical protein B0H13DRAFT_2326369 [Mycena leptocephala]